MPRICLRSSSPDAEEAGAEGATEGDLELLAPLDFPFFEELAEPFDVATPARRAVS